MFFLNIGIFLYGFLRLSKFAIFVAKSIKNISLKIYQ